MQQPTHDELRIAAEAAETDRGVALAKIIAKSSKRHIPQDFQFRPKESHYEVCHILSAAEAACHQVSLDSDTFQGILEEKVGVLADILSKVMGDTPGDDYYGKRWDAALAGYGWFYHWLDND